MKIMFKIFLTFVLIVTMQFAFSGCDLLAGLFPEDDDIIGGESFDIQFVNQTPAGIKKLKFYENGQDFVEFTSTIGSESESSFKTVPAEDVEKVTSATSVVSYSLFSYNLSVTIDPELGPIEGNKVYSIELDTSLCFVLWERANADLSFGSDTGKRKIGSKSCIDEEELPDLPF